MYDSIIYLKPGGRLQRGSAVIRESSTGRLARFSIKSADLLTQKRFSRRALANAGVFFESDIEAKDWIPSLAQIVDDSDYQPVPITHSVDGYEIESQYFDAAIAAEPHRAWVFQ